MTKAAVNPNLAELADALRRSLNTPGWIGDASDFVEEILDYIDGVNDELIRWASKYEPLPADRYYWRSL